MQFHTVTVTAEYLTIMLCASCALLIGKMIKAQDEEGFWDKLAVNEFLDISVTVWQTPFTQILSPILVPSKTFEQFISIVSELKFRICPTSSIIPVNINVLYHKFNQTLNIIKIKYL